MVEAEGLEPSCTCVRWFLRPPCMPFHHASIDRSFADRLNGHWTQAQRICVSGCRGFESQQCGPEGEIRTLTERLLRPRPPAVGLPRESWSDRRDLNPDPLSRTSLSDSRGCRYTTIRKWWVLRGSNPLPPVKSRKPHPFSLGPEMEPLFRLELKPEHYQCSARTWHTVAAKWSG